MTAKELKAIIHNLPEKPFAATQEGFLAVAHCAPLGEFETVPRTVSPSHLLAFALICSHSQFDPPSFCFAKNNKTTLSKCFFQRNLPLRASEIASL